MEDGVNDEFSSLEGKTILMSENREVSVKKFTGFSNGTATVKLSDGTEAAEKDVAFADDGENVLFHFIAREDGMTASAANAIWSLWQANKQSTAPVPAAKFRDSAFAVWRAGVRGDSKILNDNDSRASALTVQQKENIYETGRKAAQDSTDAAQKNVSAVYEQAKAVLQKKGKTSNKTYRAVTAEGVRVKDMSPTQKDSFLLAQRIAPAVKADIEVYNGGKEWGYYNPRTDKICLNINAKWDNETMLAFTLSHELLHRAKKGSPAQYQAFADFLVKKFGEQGADIEEMVVQQLKAADEFDKTVPENQRIHMTEDMAFEEVVADACQRMLLDTDAGKRLAEFGAQSEQNRSFLKRFARWLRELLENLRNAFKDVKPDSLAAKEFAKFEENVKQTLADMFVDMNIDAGEKLSTIKEAGLTEKITTETGGVRYKISDLKIEREIIDYLDAEKVSKAIDAKVADLVSRGKVVPLSKESIAKYEKSINWSIYKEIRQLLKDVLNPYSGISVVFKHGDHGAVAYLTKKGVNHAVGGPASPKKAAAFEKFSELVKNAEYAYSSPHDAHANANKNIAGNTLWDIFVAIGTVDGEPYPIIFNIRSIDADLRSQIYAIATKNETGFSHEDAGHRKMTPAHSNYRTSPVSNRSITQAEGSVNENFEEPVGSPKKLPVKEYAADREMLVDMFEQMVTNSTEYKVLQDYKSHFYELSALEAAVEKLTAEIDRYSDPEGARYTAKLKQLKLERQQAINRLNYYDGKLLGLEKSGVLKAMIDRSLLSTKAYYKERNERREADIRSYYEESVILIFLLYLLGKMR